MKDKRLNVIAIALLFMSMICIFFGISYAIFTYLGEGMTNNAIQTGRIVFSYSDADGGSNGINIEDAMPIPDSMGKILSGDGEYFDFSVSATTTTANIAYEVAINKSDDSTLDPQYVKVYLTTFEGTEEKETPLTIEENGVVTYDSLNDTTNSLLTGKTIYYGSVQAGEVAYAKRFRFRMWVEDQNELNFDYSKINDKYFSVKVNVAATSAY